MLFDCIKDIYAYRLIFFFFPPSFQEYLLNSIIFLIYVTHENECKCETACFTSSKKVYWLQKQQRIFVLCMKIKS